MATYTLNLQTNTDSTATVGQYYGTLYNVIYQTSKPSNWIFTDTKKYTINSVIFQIQFSESYLHPYGSATMRAPADISVHLDDVDNEPIIGPKYFLFDVWTQTYSLSLTNSELSDILTGNFNFLYVNLAGVYVANDAVTAIAPINAQLIFNYTENYTQLPAPSWNIDTTNYLYNGKIYVSNSSSTPSGKNQLTLQWNGPTVSEQSDKLDYYTLKAQINNGTTYTILTTPETSYTVDFSNFRYNIKENTADTLSLVQGTEIIFKISTTGVNCGTSSENSYSSIYINYWPTAPTVSNTIIPFSQTSSTFQYSLGTDSTHENMPVSFRWKQAPDSEWLTSTSINDDMLKGDEKICNADAYTYDNWDVSLPTSFTITKNTKPIVTFKANFSESATDYTNNTITITDIAEESGKILKNIRYYIRAANTESLVSVATIKTLPLSNNTYVINPFDINSLVYAAQHYQVGVQANDGIEDSDITWSSDVVQIYGGIELAEDPPDISHTDTEVNEEKYGSYYKNKTINLTYKFPKLPVGITKLYYQIAYLSNAQTNTWTLLGNRTLFITTDTNDTLKTQVTIPAILSSLVLRVNIYNANVEETQVVYSGNSNTLYYASPPTWGDTQGSLSLAYTDFSNGIMATDGRYCVRPTLGDTLFTSDGKSVSAFSITVPIPNSICQTVGYPTDLLYQISVIGKDDKGNPVYQELQSYQSIPNYETNNPNFINSSTYKQLQDLNIYTLCVNKIEKRKGPYTLSLVVTFKDPFDGTIETLKSDLIIDFREKPQPAQDISLGRNGVYNSNNYTEDLKELVIEGTTVLFPSNSSDSIILNNEVLLVSFSQKLSYPTQQIEEYYFDLYNKTNELIKTFIVKSIDNIDYYEIPINNLFQGYGEYYLKIRAKDVESYAQNVSLDKNKSNSLFGVAREKPIMTLHNLKVNFTDSGIEYIIPALSFSEQNESINVLWPESYIQTHAYNRPMVYEFNPYNPSCIYFLEFSAFPDFSTKEEIKLGEISDGYYNILTYEGTSGELEGAFTKIYIRGKIEYTTGLECTGSLETPTGLAVNTQIIYSPVISFIGDQPTASYRKNAIGINSLPNFNEVFSVSSLGEKNIITFSGEDGNNPSIFHALHFNLSEGELITENFDLGIKNFSVVTEAEINDFSFKT